jgi:formamidopyrimidine-DNA glycosylase
MPELPEVETVRAGLEPVLRGRRFVRVEQRRADLRFPLPERFVERLTGRKVERLDRRAKYILVHLDGGEVLAIHLGMTGRFSVMLPRRSQLSHGVPSPLVGEGQGGGDCRTSAAGVPPTPNPSPPGGGESSRRSRRGSRSSAGEFQLGDYTYEHGRDAKHDHLVFQMSGGAVVTYNDARRFGYMTLIREQDLAQDAFFKGLGVEPLGDDLTPEYLARRAEGRKADLKALLMDQRIVAGLGNIYVCEALFRAGLSPFKPAGRLATGKAKPTPAANRLVPQIKAVLADAIRAGGSTLRDYKQADGSIGAFQDEFQVYGREGEPCRRPDCRGRVRRKTQGGRSTFYCPVCQR